MNRRALLSALVSGLLVAGAAAPSAIAATKPKPKPKIVGSVIAIGGSKKLTVNGKRLAKGTRLVLGQHLVMGRGVTATLRLVRPANVSAARDLIDLRPVKGAKFTVKLSRKGTQVTVRITPAK